MYVLCLRHLLQNSHPEVTLCTSLVRQPLCWKRKYKLELFEEDESLISKTNKFLLSQTFDQKQKRLHCYTSLLLAKSECRVPLLRCLFVNLAETNVDNPCFALSNLVITHMTCLTINFEYFKLDFFLEIIFPRTESLAVACTCMDDHTCQVLILRNCPFLVWAGWVSSNNFYEDSKIPTHYFSHPFISHPHVSTIDLFRRRPPATGHRPPATGHRPSATGQPCHRPTATGQRQPLPPASHATGHRPPAIGYRPCHRPTASHAAGHWPPAASCHRPAMPPATGHRLLASHATGHRPAMPPANLYRRIPRGSPWQSDSERGSGVSLKVANTLIYTFSHVNGMPQTEPVDLSPVTLVTNRLSGACAALKPTCRRAALGILYFVGRFCC